MDPAGVGCQLHQEHELRLTALSEVHFSSFFRHVTFLGCGALLMRVQLSFSLEASHANIINNHSIIE